ISAKDLHGYEIHMGETEFFGDKDEHPITITERRGEKCAVEEGTSRADGMVFGTYIHGIFDHDEFRRAMLNVLRVKKGLEPLKNTRSLFAEKQRAYDRLAETVRANLDMDKVREILAAQ
nr:cobyric acid synthase CobQ [Schwartzia sp. (in: firmicutes)]